MFSKIRACLSGGAVAILFLASLVAARAQSDAIADFYRGKTMTLVVGSAPGGGYDLNARTMARHLGRHIPGNPSIIVQNMPGAGSIAAANHVYQIAPQDGTVIALVQRPIPFEPLLSPAGARFDVRKINWLGSTAAEIGVVVATQAAPQQSIEDVFKGEMIVGGSGPATDTELFPRILNRILGTKFRVIGGYASESQIVLAMERGEIQGVGNWSWTNIRNMHSDWVRDKKIKLLLQLGPAKHPDLPHVPIIHDLARTDQERQMFETLMEMKRLGRPYMAGPGVPEDRVAALRAAFMATLADPAYIEEVERSKGSVEPVSGVDMQKTLSRVYSQPPELLKVIREAISN